MTNGKRNVNQEASLAAEEKAIDDAVAAAVGKAEPTKPVEKDIVIQGTTETVRSADNDTFIKQLVADRNKPAPEAPPQPVLTDRQRSTIEQEMAAGAARVKFFEEQNAKRPAPEPDPAEGRNTPVFRPEAYTEEKGNVSKGLSTGAL